MAIEIPEDAYTLTPSGHLGGKTSVAQGGEFLGEFSGNDFVLDKPVGCSTSAALAFIKARMEKEQFWPSIVWVSDHGNWWYIDTDGNEIKVETAECEFCGEEFEADELEFHAEQCDEAPDE